MTGAAPGPARVPAEAIIDFVEIYILDVQPLTPWQRELIRYLYVRDGHVE